MLIMAGVIGFSLWLTSIIGSEIALRYDYDGCYVIFFALRVMSVIATPILLTMIFFNNI